MAVFYSPTTIAEIALAVLTAFMIPLTLLCVTRRRIILLFSTVISPICYSLVFYIIGIALSAHPSSSDDESATFACAALLLVGLAKSIVSHSFPDGQKALSASSYEQLLQMLFVLVLVLPPWSFGDRALFVPLVGALFVLWVGQLKARVLSASTCSRIKDDLLISEYMSKKHNAHQDLDPTDFQGLNYIVSGEVSTGDSNRFFWKHVINLAMELRRKSGKLGRYIPNLGIGIPGTILNPVIRYDTLVTIEDIWMHRDMSESRDVCLSFALFKLLRRRFRGCFLHESGHDKTQLFMRGLLSSQSLNPLRAFHIVEAELGFVFDFFFTCRLLDYRYTIIYTILSWAACLNTLLRSSRYAQKDEGVALFPGIVLLFPLLGFLQIVSSLLSNKLEVSLVVNICRRRKQSFSKSYTQIQSYKDSIMLRLMHGTIKFRFGSTWSNRAGQYCIFHGDYRSFTTRQISDEAKEALLNALRYSDGNLSDGRSSLSRNQAEALHWACDQEFVAEKILVWHIATTLCDVGHHAMQSKEASDISFLWGNTRNNYQVATLISSYCAYLVGFAPELVADDMYATRLAFDNARVAAMERLEGEGSLTRMYESAAMMDIAGTDFAATANHDVVLKGKMLVAQLIKLPTGFQWKVLAEFWAELILFVSPSHNSAAHLERLKDGGELITHLWALLTHGGILKRPSGREDHTASIQASDETSMLGEATTSVTPQTEIEVVIESLSKY